MLQLVTDSLRYWVEEMHVDGFRFDLAATLGRETYGFDPDGAFFSAIRQDRVLARRQADRRALGHRAGRLPGRQFPARLVRLERPLPRRGAPVLAGRRGHAAGARRALTGSSDLFERRGRRPWTSVNYDHRARRLHAERPRLLQRQAQRGQRRGQPRRPQRQLLAGTTASRGRPTTRRSSTLRDAADAQHDGDAAALAGHADAARRRRVRPHARAATTTPTARTARSPGSTGRASATRAASCIEFTRRLIALRKAHPVLRRARFLHGREVPRRASRTSPGSRPRAPSRTRAVAGHARRCIGLMLNGRAGAIARRDGRTPTTTCC